MSIAIDNHVPGQLASQYECDNSDTISCERLHFEEPVRNEPFCYGQPGFSLVMGVGKSISVLNPDMSMLKFHAWLEYASKRLERDEVGLAFLFVPSFTIGLLFTTI